MNYYKRHLGDYAKDTRHLSLAEHGAFCLLLDYYYSTERPIPDDRCERIANAYADAEREAVRNVLASFFTLTPEGWRNQRADEEIAEFHGKSLKAKASAEKRWSERNAKAYANASETHGTSQCDRNASHKPLAISHKEATPIVPKGDSSADAVLDAYHEILPACQRISVLNDKRRRRIAAAVKLAKRVCADQGWDYEPVEFWRAYFTECAADAWMRGEVPNPNNPAWKQNLDVLLAEDRFAGVMDKAIAAMRGGA